MNKSVQGEGVDSWQVTALLAQPGACSPTVRVQCFTLTGDG